LRWGDRRGYPSVSLSVNDKKQIFAVHHLVAAAFIPRVEGKPLVLHIDDNKKNPRVGNLKWGTHAENSADMVQKSRQATGERHPNSKLTEDQVREIRRLYAGPPRVSQTVLAMQFGVNQTCISTIVRRAGWQHA
jgi:hypothetical protein